MSDWIPAEKDGIIRAPDIETEFIAYVPTKGGYWMQICTINWENNLEMDGEYSGYEPDDVTHWMPLPTPPGEDA